MIVEEFTPVKLFVKESQALNQIAIASAPESYFQTLVECYNKTKLSKLSDDDLVMLLQNVKRLCYNKLTENKEIHISGINLDADKMFDIIEKPQTVLDLIELVNNFNNNPNTQHFDKRITNFCINENGNVELKEDNKNNIFEQFTIYAKTQHELDIFNGLKEVEKSINNVQGLKKVWNIDDKMFVDLFDYNRNSHSIALNVDFMKVYRN